MVVGSTGDVFLDETELRAVLADRQLMLVDDGMGTSPTLSPLSQQILKAVVDQHELTIGKDGPEFRLLKKHAAG